MSIQPDPYLWSIFNLLGSAGANIGQSFSQDVLAQRNARLGEEAVRKYVEDPSLENYVNASRFVNLDEAIKAAKTSAETVAIEQQNALRNLELLQALAASQAAPSPLAHLTPDETKFYNAEQQAIQNLLDNASVSRQLRISGSPADVAAVAQRHGLNPSLVNKLKKGKDRQELGRTHETQNLMQAARKQVSLKLMENSSLSPTERKDLEHAILGSENFASFLNREVDRVAYGKGGLYSPNALLEKVGQYIEDTIAGREEQQEDQTSPQRIFGRMEMPSVTTPSTPPPSPPATPTTEVPPVTPSGEPPVAPTTQPTQEPQPTQAPTQTLDAERLLEKVSREQQKDIVDEAALERRQALSFKSKKDKFIQQARSYDLYKDWSDSELLKAKENNSRLSTIRNQMFVDRAIGKPSYTEKDYQTVKSLALKYALIEDFFYKGVKPTEAEEISNALLNRIGKDDFQDLLENINTGQDLNDAINDVLSYKRHQKSFAKELPDDVSEGITSQLVDTAVVGGARGLLAYLDQAPMALIGSVVKGTAASPYVAVGSYALSGSGYLYRFLRNNRADNFFRAFFTEPKTASEKKAFYDSRYRFADKFKSEFTPEERAQIIDGKYKDNQKLLSLINQTSFFEQFLDGLFRPVSALDERTFKVADKLESKFSNYNQSAVLASEMFGSLRGSHTLEKKVPGLLKSAKERTQGVIPPLKAKAGAPAEEIIDAEFFVVTPPESRVSKQPGKGITTEQADRKLLSFQGPEEVVSVKQPKITLDTPDGKVIPIQPTSKQALNAVRNKLKKRFSPVGRYIGNQERIFDERWNAWAKSPGTMPFETFTQGGSLFAQSPLFRHALISGVYGGVDAVLDEMLEDPYWTRVAANMGFGVLGQIVDSHYYKVKNRAFDINHDWYSDMFKDFTKDFQGTTTTKGKDTVFDIPNIKKQITFTPDGNVVSSTTPTKPSNLPEGPISFNEFRKTQSDNFISFAGVSENLGLPIPDFTRTPPSKKVIVDERAAQRFLESTWDTKTLLLEDARQRDLAPFIKQDLVTKILGDSVEQGTVPGTNDLKKVATALYKEIETAAENVSIETIAKDLNKNINNLADYFSTHPSLGASFGKAKNLIDDVRKTLFSGELSIKDLINYHQTINQTKRSIQASLEKEYKPDSELLLDFYRGLDGMIRRSLPKEVRTILNDADNAYFAYKFSEKLDSLLKDTKISDFNDWLRQKSSFDQLAKTIYSDFKDSNVANMLKKSFVHDDYFRSNMNRKNVELIRNGKPIRKGSAIEEVVDVNELISEVKQGFFLTALGKAARFIGNIGKNVDRLSVQKRGEQAVKSSPFIVGSDFRPLVDASRDAHDLRSIRTPNLSKTPDEAPILKKIDEYTKQREKKAAEQKKKDAEQRKKDLADSEEKQKKAEARKVLDSYKEYFLLRRALMLKFHRSKNPKDKKTALDHLRSVNEKVKQLRNKLPERLLKYFDDEQANIDEFLRRFG